LTVSVSILIRRRLLLGDGLVTVIATATVFAENLAFWVVVVVVIMQVALQEGACDCGVSELGFQ